LAKWAEYTASLVPEVVFPWVRRKVLRPVKRAIFPRRAPVSAGPA